MNPEEKKAFEQMKKDIAALKPLLSLITPIREVIAWMAQKKKQQITLPLDEPSKKIIKAIP